MAARQARVVAIVLAAISPSFCRFPMKFQSDFNRLFWTNALEFLLRGGYFHGSRGDDADPGSLGRQHADGRGPQGVLRIIMRP